MAVITKLLELQDGRVETVDLSTKVLEAQDFQIGAIPLSGIGQIAFFTGQIAGMTSNVSISANDPGVIGNSVSLSFDGSTSITTAISNWNTGNPSNHATLTSGNGSQIPNNSTSITLSGGLDASGASKVGVFGTPTNYSPATSDVQAHLEAIDTALSGVGPSSGFKVDKFTLSGTDISNKFVTLSLSPATPSATILLVSDAPNMFYGADFTVTGNQLGWNGLALDGILASSDTLTVIYAP